MESLSQSVNLLLQLRYILPTFRGHNATYKLVDLEKMADDFLGLDPALQEASFDCLIAVSKISMHLKNAICADNMSIMYEKTGRAQKIRDEIKARTDFQEYLTHYMDLLASMANDPRMNKFADRLDRYASAMRSIKLEMT